MKKIFLLAPIVLVAITANLAAENAAVTGKWDCEAVVDMTYPFLLVLSEEGDKLTGHMEGDQGSIDLLSPSFENPKLKFQIDYSGVGLIDFEAKVQGATMKGSLGNDMFQGDLSCKRKQ